MVSNTCCDVTAFRGEGGGRNGEEGGSKFAKP